MRDDATVHCPHCGVTVPAEDNVKRYGDVLVLECPACNRHKHLAVSIYRPQ